MIPVLPCLHNKSKPLAAEPDARCWRRGLCQAASNSCSQQTPSAQRMRGGRSCDWAVGRRACWRPRQMASGLPAALLPASAGGRPFAGKRVGVRAVVVRAVVPAGRLGACRQLVSFAGKSPVWVACRCRPPATCRLRSAAASLVTPSGRPCRGCPSPRSS